MRGLQSLGAALTIVTSILLFRIVHHGYIDHGHLDVFHLLVAIGAAFIGLFLIARAFPRRT